MRICVYCGASENVADVYKEFLHELGKEIAKSGHTLVYGGGKGGLMGAVAYGALEEHGEVISVVPDFMNQWEPIIEDTILIHTLDMGTRKTIMEDNSDAFIIAPGGIGTLDEFFQNITLKELGRHSKPVLVYNINGYYDKLAKFLQECMEENFIRTKVINLLKVYHPMQDDPTGSAAEAIAYLENAISGKEYDYD